MKDAIVELTDFINSLQSENDDKETFMVKEFRGDDGCLALILVEP